MTDLEEAGLRGEVRECITETDQGSGIATTVQRFIQDGKLLELRQQNQDGSEWRVTYSYNERGQLLEREHRGTPGAAFDSHLRYEYDSSGRLTRVTARNLEGKERVFQSHNYDTKGEHRLTEYPDPALRTLNMVSYCASMQFQLTADAVAILTFFDAAGRPTKRILYDGNDMVIRRVLIRHDEKGRITEEGEAAPGGKIRDDFRHLYRYDELGRKIEADMYWYDFGGRRVQTVYNEQGDIAEERISSRPGLLGTGDEGVTEWLQRYDYSYDQQRNWIRRTLTTHAPPEGVGRVDRTERRRIFYWSTFDAGPSHAQ